MLVYFGTYTGGKSQGIYLSHFDTTTGRLSAPELAVETRNPSFLAVHPSHRWIYAAGEMDDFGGRRAGSVSAFRIEPVTGHLTLLNAQASGGTGPCHVAVDRTGRCVMAANYGSGSIAAFQIQPDGELGKETACIQHHGSSVDPRRQEGPHAHFIAPDPGNRFALTCDLGLDEVLVYRLDAAKGTLVPNEPAFARVKPGLGPRHLAFHPNGRVAYVVSEMGSSVTAFDYDAKWGRLKEIQTLSTLPAEFQGQRSGAEVQVDPTGRFLYASNRGNDSITEFAIDGRSGSLTWIGCEPSGGRTPRHFTLDPSGRWMLVENQDSNNVVVFRVEPKDGHLTPTGQQIEVGAPVCAVFAGSAR